MQIVYVVGGSSPAGFGRILISSGLLLAAIILSPNSGLAQPVFEHVKSLEWMVAEAKVVVRANIEKTVQQQSKNNRVWETVSVDVIETLKGQHRPNIKFVLHRYKSDDSLEVWKTRNRELMLFLADSKRQQIFGKKYTEQALALIPGNWKHSCVALDPDANLTVYTTSLDVLSDPKTIVRQVREAIADERVEKPGGSHALQSGYTIVTVPIDSRLEDVAKRWAANRPKHKNRISFKEAVKALTHFQSKSNTEFFKSLLDDPTVTHRTLNDGKWVAVKQREYCIRQLAYETLQNWGVDIEKPVLIEQLLRKEVDPNERAAITKIEAMNGSVEYSSVEAPGTFRTVIDLYLGERDTINDLSPAAKFPNLQRLSLVRVPIKDLSPIADLKDLQWIRAWETPIRDLSPLSEMQSITSLELAGTSISDLSPISKLEKLIALDLRATPITDFSPLAEMKNLQFLELEHTQISDLSPLAGLTKLQNLNLRRTPARDLSPLSNLKNLKQLQLDGAPVVDISPLERLKNLESLDLSETKVEDLSPLAQLTNLRWLDLENTTVRDIGPLKGLKHIWPLPPGRLPKVPAKPEKGR